MGKYWTILCLILVIQMNAQNVIESKELSFIEVNGTAEMEVLPDEIYIHILLKENGEGKDKRSVAIQEENLKDSLRAIGIDLAQLTLLNSYGNYRHTGVFSKDVVESAEYSLKVSDAKTVGKAFEKFDHCDVYSAHISKISHSKIEQFKREMRIAAAKLAKEKADYLLAATGGQTGKPMIVREEENSPLRNQLLYNTNQAYGSFDKMSKEDNAIEFEKIVVKCSIYAKFEIK
jgi:uncharacterized protein YggE